MREKSRLTKVKWLALALVVAAAIGASATAKWSRVGAAADEKYPGPSECNKEYNERTLAGCFGWSSTAYMHGVTTDATAAIGLMHLDGAGNLTGWYSGDALGVPVTTTYTGNYTVNPNGTGQMTFVEPSGVRHDFDFVIVKGSSEVLMSSTRPGNIQNVEMKRQ